MFVPIPVLECSAFPRLPVEKRRYTRHKDNKPDERLEGLCPYRVQENAEVDQYKKDGQDRISPSPVRA